MIAQLVGVPGRRRLGGLVLLAVLLPACGYSLQSGRVKPGLESVAVPYFENASTEPEIEIDLTEAIIDGLIADRTLKVVAEDQADVLLLGTIRSYAFREAFFGEDRQAVEYQINVGVEVSLVDRRTNEAVVGPQRIQGSGSYFLEDGPDGEALARQEAAEELVQNIVRLVVEDW